MPDEPWQRYLALQQTQMQHAGGLIVYISAMYGSANGVRYNVHLSNVWFSQWCKIQCTGTTLPKSPVVVVNLSVTLAGKLLLVGKGTDGLYACQTLTEVCIHRRARGGITSLKLYI